MKKKDYKWTVHFKGLGDTHWYEDVRWSTRSLARESVHCQKKIYPTYEFRIIKLQNGETWA